MFKSYFMLLFKKIDVYGQAFAAILCICSPIFTFQCYTMMSFYFVIGTWQIISVLLNLTFAKGMPMTEQRKTYQHILLLTIILFAVAYTNEVALMLFLFLLFIVSPFFAVWYFILNQKELHIWEARDAIRFR